MAKILIGLQPFEQQVPMLVFRLLRTNPVTLPRVVYHELGIRGSAALSEAGLTAELEMACSSPRMKTAL